MVVKLNKSIVVAITGGIGCGKTTVSNIIRDMGYIVISSDENAKIIMNSNKHVMEQLIDTFGIQTFSDDGLLNKEYISNKVFGTTDEHEKALQKLNSIVHPVVITKLIEEVEKHEKNGEKLIFVESALTFEAQLEEGFDYIIVVDSKEELVMERLKRRSEMKDDEIRYRINQQIPQELKVQNSDFVIQNNSNIDELKKSVDFVVNIFVQLAK